MNKQFKKKLKLFQCGLIDYVGFIHIKGGIGKSLHDPNGELQEVKISYISEELKQAYGRFPVLTKSTPYSLSSQYLLARRH